MNNELHSLLMNGVLEIDAKINHIAKSLWKEMAKESSARRKELLSGAALELSNSSLPLQLMIAARVMLFAYFRCDGDYTKMDDAIDIEVGEITSKVAKMAREILNEHT